MKNLVLPLLPLTVLLSGCNADSDGSVTRIGLPDGYYIQTNDSTGDWERSFTLYEGKIYDFIFSGSYKQGAESISANINTVNGKPYEYANNEFSFLYSPESEVKYVGKGYSEGLTLHSANTKNIGQTSITGAWSVKKGYTIDISPSGEFTSENFVGCSASGQINYKKSGIFTFDMNLSNCLLDEENGKVNGLISFISGEHIDTALNKDGLKNHLEFHAINHSNIDFSQDDLYYFFDDSFFFSYDD
ncbi:hypothetical protein [Veronia pacifica]|uniref:hypothetical protein n=2 Tax=Veronia pacifica TaxID=1080227 RepID=UPI003639326F